jgi:hypothetical protein
LRQFVENPRNIFPHLGHGHVATRIPQITMENKIATSTVPMIKSVQYPGFVSFQATKGRTTKLTIEAMAKLFLLRYSAHAAEYEFGTMRPFSVMPFLSRILDRREFSTSTDTVRFQ